MRSSSHFGTPGFNIRFPRTSTKKCMLWILTLNSLSDFIHILHVLRLSQIARRRRSASGYKRQIVTSGPPPVSRRLAGGTFSLLADVGPPSADHRRPTIDLPLAGHCWLAIIVPTMSAILKKYKK